MDLTTLFQLPPDALEIALLVLTRLTAMFMIAPVFSQQAVPARMRIGLAVMITILILPIELAAARPALPDVYTLLIALAKELAVGLTLGFVAMLFFYGVQLAGHMLGLQMGFGMSAMFDPTTRSQSSELAVMLTMLATLSFLLVDGHHYLIAGIYHTFQVVPLGGFVPTGALIAKVLRASTDLFDVALSLMLPITGVLLVIELGLAILNRVVPQMNVFSLGANVKIVLGLATLAATLPLFGETLDIMLDRLTRQLMTFF